MSNFSTFLALSLVLFASSTFAFEQPAGGGVVTLTPWNFAEVVDGSRHVLVAFTADWCTHCQALYPHWERIAQSFANHPEINLIVGKVDAQAHASLNAGFNIKGLPTILLFMRGSTKPAHQYDGERSTVAILRWISEQLALPNPVKWAPPKVNVTVSPSQQSIERLEKLDGMLSVHFQNLDGDKDGFLTEADIKKSLVLEGEKENVDEKAKALFKSMDKRPKDGKISKSEFLDEGN